uniref:Dipeptidyl aminopeptidase-like protein 6 n=1 Tax=Panagrellus redivivus TaxID=6233 RepID=A0A7E4W556_PANRE
MVCDAYSLPTQHFPYGRGVADHYDPRAKYDRIEPKSTCFRVFVLVFTTVVILSVIAAVALLLTQKPVDFDDFGGFTYGDSLPLSSNESSNRLYSRKIAKPKDAPEITINNVMTTLPRGLFTFYWLHDNTLILKENGGYVQVNTNKVNALDERRSFIAAEQLHNAIKDSQLLFNSDSSFVAFSKTTNQGFRHSSKSVIEIAKFNKGRLSGFRSVGPLSTGDEPLKLFEWNPARGSKDFVFVHENDIYYQEDWSQKGSARKITKGGSQFRSFGIADWLYEEEIFAGSKAVWWAKSGNYLAYALFDDRNVSKVVLPMYNWKPYPTYTSVPYPKTGDIHQPAVSLWLWNKKNNTTQIILPPKEFLTELDDTDYYLFSTDWISLEEKDNTTSDYLIVVWANRNQNLVCITACQYGVPCRTLKILDYTLGGLSMYAEPANFRVNFYSKTGVFMILPREYTDGNVYEHVAHIEIIQEGKYHPISGYHGGAYDVSELVGFDKARDDIFFAASGGPIGERHIYRVPYASTEDNVAPQCVTCLITDCKRADAYFSPTGTMMIVACSAAFKHTAAYLKTTNNILEHYKLPNTATNKEFSPAWEIPDLKFDTVKLQSGIDAQVRFVLPPNFNAKYTYPVLLNIYAGPNTAGVVDDTPSDILTYLASVRQYIIVNIDGRGSANRGWRLREPQYKNLGGPEIEDQIDALKELLEKYSFLDKERVAAFGWSYGGFATSHIVAKDGGQTVKCAIAVAPVVDFRFYDTAYTERYMLQLTENTKGYSANTVLREPSIEQFKHVKFMLAHGHSDDNVHYQNSALLSMALQEHNIHFRQLVYTNQDHFIASTRVHLYSEIDDFLFSDCYGFKQ